MRAAILLPFLLAGCPTSSALDAPLDATITDDVPGLDVPSLDVPVVDVPVADVPGLDVPSADVPLQPDGGATGCGRNSDCVIRAESCCGSCGAATADDYLALHRDDLAGYTAAVCEGIGCPECARPDDPLLVATCEAGACTGHDLRLEPLTECADAADCQLAPRTCCDCGLVGLDGAIAYNPARGSTNDYVCDADAPPCPPCVPTFDGLAADCVAGRCTVVPR